MSKARLISYLLFVALLIIWVVDSLWNRPPGRGPSKEEVFIEKVSPRPLVGFVVQNGNGRYGIRGFSIRDSRHVTEIYWENTTIIQPISIYTLIFIFVSLLAIIILSVYERLFNT